MNGRDAALRRYFRTIRSYLPCSRKLKKQILEEFRNSISVYLAENPDVDFHRIEAHFGTPQRIAAAYVDEMNTGELLHTIYIRRRIVTTISACAMIVVLMWGLVVGMAYIDAYNNTRSYYDFYLIED